ncbi:Amino acid transporter, transmembrane [Salix suchowensis]|nr:Amino acid transporter, transmembrane [Salix suchowensis]
MATSAFKSTTKRTPIGSDKSSSSARQRSRSLSRSSRPNPPEEFSDDYTVPSRGRFVSMDRGSGVPDISLDDLAIQLLSLGDRGRSGFRSGDVSVGERVVGGSLRRGRSVSRQGSESTNNSKSYSGGGGGKLNSEGSNSRRRRSVSAVRYQVSDSESDLEHSQNSRNHANSRRQSNGNCQVPLSNKPPASNHRPGLRRSLSQKDLKYPDGYSSHSSSLTDDEGRDSCSNKNGFERTIRTVYAQKKAEHPTGDDMNGGLYEAMRKELRHAVEEIRMEIEHSMEKTNIDSLQSGKSDDFQGGSTLRKNHATKLEQSEKCRQDLLAKLLSEKQLGRDISKIVKELLSDSKNTVSEKPSRARRRSNDRSRMSERLTEEAEKYFEDFISNVEDTDISSLDGERSDTSSTLGGITKTETFQRPVISKSRPVEMDGVVLPWLQWETSNDACPLSFKNKEPKSTPKRDLWDAAQEASLAQELSTHSISSRGSWSPGLADGHSTNIRELKGSKFGELESYKRRISFGGTRSQFDVDEYLKRPSDEDFLLERWKQQQRIHSGGLLLCNRMFF